MTKSTPPEADVPDEVVLAPEEERDAPAASRRPAPATGRPLPPSARAASQAPSASAEKSNGKRAGLHVWVRTSARDPTLLLVRLLPDGHPAPPGAYEAYLQPVDEGTNLLTPKH